MELLSRKVEVERISSLYRSRAVGYVDQPDFLNLVVVGRTTLSPRGLLVLAHEVEDALGRKRPFPNAPRTLDVDLLAYGERAVATPELTLPHPRLHLRGFVLHPLVEVAPGWMHPVLRRTARELLTALPATEPVKRIGPPPGTPPLAPRGGRG